MNGATLTPELRVAAPELARRLAAILLSLAALIARGFLRDPRRVGLIVPLCNYLNRTIGRFARLMARGAAGRRRAGVSRAARRSGSRAALPASSGWLIAPLRHDAVAHALQLKHLLGQPDAVAILAQLPQAARILRPVCRMLGFSPVPVPAAVPMARPLPAVQVQVRAVEVAAVMVPAPRPLHETVPCPHVLWPWFPRKPAPSS